MPTTPEILGKLSNLHKAGRYTRSSSPGIITVGPPPSADSQSGYSASQGIVIQFLPSYVPSSVTTEQLLSRTFPRMEVGELTCDDKCHLTVIFDTTEINLRVDHSDLNLIGKSIPYVIFEEMEKEGINVFKGTASSVKFDYHLEVFTMHDSTGKNASLTGSLRQNYRILGTRGAVQSDIYVVDLGEHLPWGSIIDPIECNASVYRYVRKADS